MDREKYRNREKKGESDRYVDSHTFMRTSQKPTQEQQEK